MLASDRYIKLDWIQILHDCCDNNCAWGDFKTDCHKSEITRSLKGTLNVYSPQNTDKETRQNPSQNKFKIK